MCIKCVSEFTILIILQVYKNIRVFSILFKGKYNGRFFSIRTTFQLYLFLLVKSVLVHKGRRIPSLSFSIYVNTYIYFRLVPACPVHFFYRHIFFSQTDNFESLLKTEIECIQYSLYILKRDKQVIFCKVVMIQKGKALYSLTKYNMIFHYSLLNITYQVIYVVFITSSNQNERSLKFICYFESRRKIYY